MLVEAILQSIEAVETDTELNDLINEYVMEAMEDDSMMEALMDVAKHLQRFGYRDFSILLLERIYQFNPQDELASLIAKGYYEYLKYDEANDWMDQVSKTNNLAIELLRADIQAANEQLETAIHIYQNLIQSFPTEPAPYKHLARLFEEHREWERAEYYYQIVYDYFESIVDIAPIRQKLLQLELLKEFIDKDRIMDLYETIEEFHSDVELYQLALAYERTGEWEKSLDYLLSAIKLNPDNLEAQLALLEVYWELGKTNQHFQQLDWLGRNLPPFDERVLEILRLLPQDVVLPIAFVKQLVDYLDLIVNEDDLQKALHLLTNYYLAQNNSPKILELLDCYAQSAEHPEYFAQLYAQVYLSLNKYLEALVAFEKAFEFQAINEANLRAYYDLLIADEQLLKAEQVKEIMERQPSEHR